MEVASFETALQEIAATSAAPPRKARSMRADRHDPVEWFLRVVCATFFLLAGAVVILPILVVVTSPAYDPYEGVCIGEQARAEIQDHFRWAVWGEGPDVPPAASDFYFDEGGSFNGSIVYWSMRCSSLEEGRQLMHRLAACEPRLIRNWEPSQYGVVMDGPAFYDEVLATPLWDVRTIKRGLVYEKVEGTRSMDYFAFDFDTLRIYGHYESGGFPQQGPGASPYRD